MELSVAVFSLSEHRLLVQDADCGAEMKPVHVNFVNNACFQVNFFARREYGLTAS
jgi:hypothetical protein